MIQVFKTTQTFTLADDPMERIGIINTTRWLKKGKGPSPRKPRGGHLRKSIPEMPE